MTARVLLVEDTASLARTYRGFLKPDGYEVTHVETGAEGLTQLDDPSFDLALLDLKLPDINGLEVLSRARAAGSTCPMIVITAHGSMHTAVEAIKAGAVDFMVKPFSADRLRLTIKNTLEKQALQREVRAFRDLTPSEGYEGFVGNSAAMQAVYRAIESAAASKATVFLTGESGTGKEVAARAIHQRSGREGEFVALNCAAIPKELIESEIFGHVKGAFTGAASEREGAAARAHRGTLFLDEICEMDPLLQTKLLRFLQTGQITKVGGSKVETVDARILCATNRDPRAEVAEGRFREDLYYRLHVIPIHLPPLRDRGDDVVLIARHFFKTLSQQENRRFADLTTDAERALAGHDWPGNVRELENVVRNVLVMQDEPSVSGGALAEAIGRAARIGPSAPAMALAEAPASLGLETARGQQNAGKRSLTDLAAAIRPLAAIERDAIERAVALCDGDVRKAAVFLEIAPATIYRKLKSWGVAPPRQRPAA